MMRSRLPPSQLPSSPHVVAVPTPGPRGRGSRQGLPTGHSEGCGGARARVSLARCRFGGVNEIARFRSRRSPGPPAAPSDPGKRVARPCGFPDAVAIRGNHQPSLSEVETTETAASDFLVGRRRRAALDCRPPLWGHGKPEKIPEQQSTCGRRQFLAARRHQITKFMIRA